MVLNKVQSASNKYYEGVTVLPVEWAYMNSRLIVKPDEEWARIIDEADNASDTETDFQDTDTDFIEEIIDNEE